MVIATPGHTEAFRGRLQMIGVDPDRAERLQKLIFLDAQSVLGQFMVGGRPDRRLFDNTIRAAMSRIHSTAGIRAYGEMVGILWQANQREAAVQLEQFWIISSAPPATSCFADTLSTSSGRSFTLWMSIPFCGRIRN